MIEDSSRTHYTGERGRHYHEIKRGVPEAALPWIARSRAQKFARHLHPSDVVLEYGVGAGWNMAALECQRRIGFDVADFLAPAVRAHGIDFVQDVGVIPDGAMDAIICHHTLEHLLQPAEALQAMHRMLKSAGKLLLFVPFEQERRYRRYDPAEPNHHLYSWNAQTAANLVAETGFRVGTATIGEFGYDRFAATWAVRWHLGETGFRCLRRCAHLLRPGREVRVMAFKE